MSQYVDGFVLPVRKDMIETYRGIAEKASKIFMEYGALEYRECVADDMDAHGMMPFPVMAKAAEGEVIVFAWIVYESREKRDDVNAKIHADPRMCEMMGDEIPFDCAKMAYGGFTTIVQA